MLKVTIPDAYLLFDKTHLKQAIRDAAKLVANDARALTRKAGGSGRVYSTPATMAKGYHVASAVGEPPAALSGLLSRSVKTRVRGKGTAASIIDDAVKPGARSYPYAKFLEVGAQGGAGSRVKGGKGKANPRSKKGQPRGTPSSRRVLDPRPFISRCLDARAHEIEQKIIEAVDLDMKLVVGDK